MNICELRLYNQNDVLIERVNFMTLPFAQPFNLRIPKATKRQLEIGNNLFRDGSDIVESRYNNSTITLQPSINFQNCPFDEATRRVEALRSRIDRIIEEARLFSVRRTYNYVKFVEDSNGIILESDILDGSFDIGDDLSWQAEGGLVVSANLSLTRRPFRRNPKVETIENLASNPHFEILRPSYTELHDRWAGWEDRINTDGSGTTPESYGVEDLDDGAFGMIVYPGAAASPDANYMSFMQFIDDLGDTPSGAVLYAEVWFAVLGSRYGGTSKWEFVRDENEASYSGVDLLPGEVPTYRDPRWVKSRHYTGYDTDQPWLPLHANLDQHVTLIRRGMFFKNTPFDWFGFRYDRTGYSVGSNENLLVIERVYFTEASNFLTADQLSAIDDRIAGSTSEPILVDPATHPGDIEWMPKAWGSGRYINPAYDKAYSDANQSEEVKASYLDIDGIGGDVQAETEIYLENYTEDSPAYGQRIQNVMAGMTSKGAVNQYRRLMTLSPTLTQGSAQGGTDSVGTNAYLVTTQATTFGTASVSGSSLDYVLSASFMYNFVYTPGLTKYPGVYHVFARIGVFGVSSNIRFRYAFQIGTSGNFSYGKEVSAPTQSTIALRYTTVDLGTFQIPDNAIDDGGYTFRLWLQYRKTAGSSDRNVYFDVMQLIPADEWFVASSIARPKYMDRTSQVRIGKLEGRDNLAVTAIPSLYFYTSKAGTDYLAAQQPYLMPRRMNRVYFQLNQGSFPPDYFSNFYTETVESVLYRVRAKYRERYL